MSVTTRGVHWIKGTLDKGGCKYRICNSSKVTSEISTKRKLRSSTLLRVADFCYPLRKDLARNYYC